MATHRIVKHFYYTILSNPAVLKVRCSATGVDTRLCTNEAGCWGVAGGELVGSAVHVDNLANSQSEFLLWCWPP